MKLSVIERMLRETDLSSRGLQFLIECRAECEWLDYKEQLHIESDKELCDFTKDVLAMKNMGGGFIVVGVKDKTWEPIGLQQRLPYDGKMLIDKVRRCSGLDLTIYVVPHSLDVEGIRGEFALIHVRSSKKRNKRRVPTLALRDYQPKESYGIRRGDIYVRHADSTEKVDSEYELSDLLDRLEAEADEESLAGPTRASPFALEDGLYRLLEKGYTRFVGRDAARQQVFDAVTNDPRIWIINVHGPGGVGKSAIVDWVTYEFYKQRAFESIIHLSAKESALTESGIRQFGRSLYSIDDLLDTVLRTFDEPIPAGLDEKRQVCTDILSAWRTLLVLDNMETVSDGRILEYLRQLPPDSQTKVLLTSRHKTGGWEYSIPVSELTESETRDFLRAKSTEVNAGMPLDEITCRKVKEVSGGLPLAIQWVVGQYKLTGNLQTVLDAVRSKDSPVLEFSFRNIWTRLSPDASAALAVMSIFDNPPTSQQITIATEWPLERAEKALAELAEVTLVTPSTRRNDGQAVHSALPITLNFARHQFSTMGDFEVSCRRRVKEFDEQTQLQESEVHRFSSMFLHYGLVATSEKKAAILCTRGQSELFSGNADNAEELFRQARDLAPQSAYVHAMSATYELARNRVGVALDLAKRACTLCDKKTGELCYTVLGRIYDVQHDRYATLDAFQRALEYSGDNVVLRHKYGVALSRAGRTREAVDEFTKIIVAEERLTPFRPALLMAYKTRIINLRRLGLGCEAVQDLLQAKKILAENPHLRGQASHIAELEDDDQG